jgi:hypothetical protein
VQVTPPNLFLHFAQGCLKAAFKNVKKGRFFECKKQSVPPVISLRKIKVDFLTNLALSTQQTHSKTLHVFPSHS